MSLSKAALCKIFDIKRHLNPPIVIRGGWGWPLWFVAIGAAHLHFLFLPNLMCVDQWPMVLVMYGSLITQTLGGGIWEHHPWIKRDKWQPFLTLILQYPFSQPPTHASCPKKCLHPPYSYKPGPNFYFDFCLPHSASATWCKQKMSLMIVCRKGTTALPVAVQAKLSNPGSGYFKSERWAFTQRNMRSAE